MTAPRSEPRTARRTSGARRACSADPSRTVPGSNVASSGLRAGASRAGPLEAREVADPGDLDVAEVGDEASGVRAAPRADLDREEAAGTQRGAGRLGDPPREVERVAPRHVEGLGRLVARHVLLDGRVA